MKFSNPCYSQKGAGETCELWSLIKSTLFGFVTLPCWLSGPAGTAAALAAGAWHHETQCLLSARSLQQGPGLQTFLAVALFSLGELCNSSEFSPAVPPHLMHWNDARVKAMREWSHYKTSPFLYQEQSGQFAFKCVKILVPYSVIWIFILY